MYCLIFGYCDNRQLYNSGIGAKEHQHSQRQEFRCSSAYSLATGNPQLDKQIQQFYSCIKKTGHTGGTKPEPSRDEVNGCYFQVFSSNGSSSSTTSSSSSFSSSGSHGHGHKHGQKTGIQTQGVSMVGQIPHLY